MLGRIRRLFRRKPDEWAALQDAPHGMGPVKEKAYLEGVLASTELAAGLASEDAWVRQAAEDCRVAALAGLARLRADYYAIGHTATRTLAEELRRAWADEPTDA